MSGDMGSSACSCSKLVEDLLRDRARLLAHVGYTEAEWVKLGGENFDTQHAVIYETVTPPTHEVGLEIQVADAHTLLNVKDATPSVEESFEEIPPLPSEAFETHIEMIEPQVESALFGMLGPALLKSDRIVWTEEQQKALDEIDEWYSGDERFFSLTGPAGTGKSTLVREVHDLYDPVLTAMTGKAALRLEQVTDAGASTLHKLMYYPPKAGEDVRFNRLRDPPGPLVVVDEASMTGPSVFADLKRWGVRTLLVGDVFQLPPVITGEDLKEHGKDYTVFSHVSGTSLKTVMRNAGGVLRAATHVRQTGQICRTSDLDAPESGYEYLSCRNPIERAVEEYLADRDDHLLITWKNSVRMNSNRIIRERLGHDGPLPDEGEPVLIKKNGQGHLNGEIVPCGTFTTGPMIGSMRTLWMTVQGSPLERLLVSFEGGSAERGGEFFDGQAPWVTDWRAYHADLKKNMLPEPLPITFGYCLTAHSSQGSQSRRTTVFLERGDDRSRYFNEPTTLPNSEIASFGARWCYTAQTRSRIYTKMIVG